MPWCQSICRRPTGREAVSKRTQVHASQTAKKITVRTMSGAVKVSTCGENSEPVFRTVQLHLDEGETLVDIELRILEGGDPIESLDGHEVMTDVNLTVEADAVIPTGRAVETRGYQSSTGGQ